MAPFVRIDGEARIILGEVQQHIGVHVIGAAVHIGARCLALARERIHPARRRAFRQQPAIFGTERAQRFQRRRPHFRQREAPLVAHQRRIDVVIMEIRQAQHPLPEGEIAMQRRQPPIGLGDQRPVNAFRNVVAGQRPLQAVVVAPRLRLEDVAAHLRGKRGAERAFERLVARPEAVEDHFAVVAIGRLALDRITLIVETHGPAGRQRHLGPWNVGGGELVANVVRPGERRCPTRRAAAPIPRSEYAAPGAGCWRDRSGTWPGPVSAATNRSTDAWPTVRISGSTQAVASPSAVNTSCACCLRS